MSQPSLVAVILSSVLPAGAVAALPLPNGAPEWVQYLAVFVGACAGPALTIFTTKVAPRYLAGRKAKKEHLAASKRARAEAHRLLAGRLEADADKANDAEAARLRLAASLAEDEADALAAEAAELEAISRPHDTTKW